MPLHCKPSARNARVAAARLGAHRRRCGGLALLLLAVSAVTLPVGSGAHAQTLPVPAQGLPGYIAGAQEVPDPGLVYKVVFDIASAGPADKVHPGLAAAARYLNTLAEYGVPPVRRQLTVLLHGDATQFVLRDAAFAARNHGHANPNTALIAALRQAGVVVRVCGQALLTQHIAPRDMLPALQVDLWAVSTLANLQLHGYVALTE
jgi:intracellular sulfur oxidation DsrE/DsrF family protein